MKSWSLLLFLVGVAATEAPCREIRKISPADRWKIEFKLSLGEKDGKWTFAVAGTTDLPAATVLQARVFVVTIVDDPIRGPREDEEPLVRVDDGRQPAFHRFEAGPGRFQENVATFARKPYSILYRAEVHYDPRVQPAAVGLKVGNAEFSQKADLRVGTDAAYQAELVERVQELGMDFLALEKVGAELGGWLARAATDPEGWIAWKKKVLASIDSLQDRNRDRFDVWAVWPEYQGRMRVRGLCDYLERIVAAVDQRDEEKGIRERLSRFEGALDEAREVIGIDAPLNALLAAPVFAAYERTMAPLRGGIDQVDVRRKIRADGVAALFDLLRMIRKRHRAYVYVNTLSARFTRLFELVDSGASAGEREEAFRAHDAALREFRKVAGLP